MKKSLLMVAAGLGLGVSGLALGNTNAKAVVWSDKAILKWIAKTPDQIGALNANGTYTVKEGDTIWAIGVHFNIKPQVIETVNGITDPYKLQIGTVLKLHIDHSNDKATIEATTPEGKSKTVTLTPKDKINPSKKFGEDVAPAAQSKVSQNQADNTKAIQKSGTLASNQNTHYQSAPAQKVNNNENLPADVVNMLTYSKVYGGPANISSKDLIINNNVIGQGTADSTGKVTISGNKASITIEGKTSTYNIQDLKKEYYNDKAQQQRINDLINQGNKNNQSN